MAVEIEFVEMPAIRIPADQLIDPREGSPSDTPDILQIEREAISAGGCPEWCGAHDRPCILRAHDRGAHHCVSCPWPADRRMVRRAPR